MGVYTFDLVPVPKPRQTRRDVWAKRPAVLAYRAFADELRLLAVAQRFRMPEYGASLNFVLPMPPSWPKKRRAELNGMGHQYKPDLDNLLKAFQDALTPDDCTIWHYAGLSKVWGEAGCILVTTPD